MLVSAIVLLSTDVHVALQVLVCFAVPNVVATGIWIRRDRWRPLIAILTLFAVVGAFSLAATAVVDRADKFGVLGYGGTTNARTMYFVIGVLTPGLMLLVYFRDRSMRKGGGDQPN